MHGVRTCIRKHMGSAHCWHSSSLGLGSWTGFNQIGFPPTFPPSQFLQSLSSKRNGWLWSIASRKPSCIETSGPSSSLQSSSTSTGRLSLVSGSSTLCSSGCCGSIASIADETVSRANSNPDSEPKLHCEDEQEGTLPRHSHCLIVDT